MQILADNGSIKSGRILYKGEDLTTWSEKQMSHFRGKCCSIVFQDPMTSLNPVFTIGNQLGEAIRLHTNRKGKEVRDRAKMCIRDRVWATDFLCINTFSFSCYTQPKAASCGIASSKTSPSQTRLAGPVSRRSVHFLPTRTMSTMRRPPFISTCT